MEIIKAPAKVTYDRARKTYMFLSGSIEMGMAEDWRTKVCNDLSFFKDLVILNPRRDDWDNSWKQSIEDARFFEQVNWELSGLEHSDLIAVYFAKDTKSPITLLEFGLFVNKMYSPKKYQKKHMVVYCPDDFWRRGNVEIVCHRYNVVLVNTYTDFIDCLKDYLHAITD